MMGQSEREMEGKGVNGERFGDGGSMWNNVFCESKPNYREGKSSNLDRERGGK